MRSLNERVTRNANRAFAKYRDEYEKRGIQITLNVIAGKMAEFLDLNQNSVFKHLRRCMDGTASWRANDIQAFAVSIGQSVEAIVGLDDINRPSDANVAELFYVALNKRIEPRLAKDLLIRLHRQLETPQMLDLIQKLTDSLLDAKSKEQAYEAAHAAIRDSAAWDVVPTKRRRKNRTDR